MIENLSMAYTLAKQNRLWYNTSILHNTLCQARGQTISLCKMILCKSVKRCIRGRKSYVKVPTHPPTIVLQWGRFWRIWPLKRGSSSFATFFEESTIYIYIYIREHAWLINQWAQESSLWWERWLWRHLEFTCHLVLIMCFVSLESRLGETNNHLRSTYLEVTITSHRVTMWCYLQVKYNGLILIWS